MRGIYKIENKINGKVYIGESLDIKRRWKEHIKDLDKNKHHSYKLQEDWNKYGKDSFNFEVISKLDKTISNYIDRFVLVIYENKYMIKYDSLNNGYNLENTLETILNGKKLEFHGKDIKIISNFKENIDNEKEFIEKDNIIYRNIFTLHFIEKRTDIEHEELINLMLNNNMIVELDKKDRYILNEDYFDNDDIICNGKSGFSFNLNIYNKLISELNLKINY